MKRKRSVMTKGLAAWLPAALVCLSVAVPVLERFELTHEVAVEREHDPSTCPPAHDHTLCTQVAANHALLASPETHTPRLRWLHTPPPARATHGVAVPFRDGHPTRAPPHS